MSARAPDPDLISRVLSSTGCDLAEVYLKQGRTRRYSLDREREIVADSKESGWAVRASTNRGSLFACGTGDIESVDSWPEPDGYPLGLPEPQRKARWQVPSGTDTPLASEGEMRALASSVGRAITDSTTARIEHLSIDDGFSESRIGNSHGLLADWRLRGAALSVVASGGPRREALVDLSWVGRSVSQIPARRLAQRIADLLSLQLEGRSISRDRSEVVMAPPVVCRLIAGLRPLTDSRTCDDLVQALGGAGRLASESWTLIDDGGLEGGPLSSPVDGEGSPTRSVTLVEEGAFVQPLLGWRDERPGCRSGGCSRRDSWRDQPVVATSHLYLKPDETVRATDLLSDLSRGYYLLDSAPAPELDFGGDRFSLEVAGFEILGGTARSPIRSVRLTGKVSALLGGLRQVARDLTFHPTPGGLVGSPTVRIAGLELRGA